MPDVGRLLAEDHRPLVHAEAVELRCSLHGALQQHCCQLQALSSAQQAVETDTGPVSDLDVVAVLLQEATVALHGHAPAGMPGGELGHRVRVILEEEVVDRMSLSAQATRLALLNPGLGAKPVRALAVDCLVPLHPSDATPYP